MKRRRTKKFWFDQVVRVLHNRHNPDDLRKSYSTSDSIFNTLRYMGFMSDEEFAELYLRFDLAQYFYERTAVEHFPHDSNRRHAVYAANAILAAPIPYRRTQVTVRRGLLLNSKLAISNKGMRYARRLHDMYDDVFTMDEYHAARAAMYPEDYGFSPDAYAHYNSYTHQRLNHLRSFGH